MNIPLPSEIKAAALGRGLSIGAMCRRADVDPALFYRWQNGSASPTLATVQKMLDAIEGAPIPPTD